MGHIHLSTLLAAALFTCGSLFGPRATAAANTPWPNGPLTTSGRWITDASGAVVQLAGVNWPAHTAAMIPEGLQYQSVAAIVARIKHAGFNVVRLTYATEMIDHIYATGRSGPDATLGSALDAVFGSSGTSGGGTATALLDQIRANNPTLNAGTSRLALFDAVVDECARQQIYVHLDNHVSKAGWCCTPLDGNSWWGDTYFDVGNWTRGLSFMAEHGKIWPNLISMSLRNELRPPLNNLSLTGSSYNWATWYVQMRRGAAAIHDANPDLLVYLSGLDGDTTLAPIVQSTPLSGASTSALPPHVFSRDEFAPGFPDKLVLELHVYWNIAGSVGGGNAATLDSRPPTADCSSLASYLDGAGFSTLTNTSALQQYPMVLTEFGFDQSRADALLASPGYASCLLSYLRDSQASWMLWPLGGSYYVREGERDADEPWGLLTHDWSRWRAVEFVDSALVPLVEETIRAGGSKPPLMNGASGGGSGGVGGGNGSSGAARSGARLDLWRVTGSVAVSCAVLSLIT
ncbi:cellulase family glycosylhydrolase [Microdochium nivale]|nr:cellulase family glycosylhydrolase [Microdochium nivale]